MPTLTRREALRGGVAVGLSTLVGCVGYRGGEAATIRVCNEDTVRHHVRVGVTSGEKKRAADSTVAPTAVVTFEHLIPPRDLGGAFTITVLLDGETISTSDHTSMGESYKLTIEDAETVAVSVAQE